MIWINVPRALKSDRARHEDNVPEGNSPENGTCRKFGAETNQLPGRGYPWPVNWSLIPVLLYADSLHSVNRLTESSGWLRRKTGCAFRKTSFAPKRRHFVTLIARKPRVENVNAGDER